MAGGGGRHCLMEVHHTVAAIVDEHGNPGILVDVDILPGGPGGGKDQVLEVLGRGEGDEAAVGLAMIVGGQHGKTLACEEGLEVEGDLLGIGDLDFSQLEIHAPSFLVKNAMKGL